jgi:spore maturation protein CgeB
LTDTRRNYVFFGLSITSTWGNGHATTYRGLIKELAHRGHAVTFLERDVPWYAENREFSELAFCDVQLYRTLEELESRFAETVRSADVVIVGSYVPQGIAVGRWVQSTAKGLKAFYDIDTPVTLNDLSRGCCEYLSRELIPGFDLYLSFTGGPTLKRIERKLGSPCARPLYCSVDPSLYFPEHRPSRWKLAYLGTYAPDRQSALRGLLLDVARQHPNLSFAVAGPQYPEHIVWPPNVERMEHLAASYHRTFYNSQEFTLNITRRDMLRAGYSPSVRLFEAAACGVPILTDSWAGLDCFFEPGTEILPVTSSSEVAAYLRRSTEQRANIAERARCRTLKFHTAAVRAAEFDAYVNASFERSAQSNKRSILAATEAVSVLSS